MNTHKITNKKTGTLSRKQRQMTLVTGMSTGVMNCYRCGRFCHTSTRHEYNGAFNCLYVTTHCKKCGDIEVNET